MGIRSIRRHFTTMAAVAVGTAFGIGCASTPPPAPESAPPPPEPVVEETVTSEVTPAPVEKPYPLSWISPENVCEDLPSIENRRAKNEWLAERIRTRAWIKEQCKYVPSLPKNEILQENLNTLGIKIPVTGRACKKTQEAVRRFTRYFGYPSTADPDTVIGDGSGRTVRDMISHHADQAKADRIDYRFGTGQLAGMRHTLEEKGLDFDDTMKRFDANDWNTLNLLEFLYLLKTAGPAVGMEGIAHHIDLIDVENHALPLPLMNPAFPLFSKEIREMRNNRLAVGTLIAGALEFGIPAPHYENGHKIPDHTHPFPTEYYIAYQEVLIALGFLEEGNAIGIPGPKTHEANSIAQWFYQLPQTNELDIETFAALQARVLQVEQLQEQYAQHGVPISLTSTFVHVNEMTGAGIPDLAELSESESGHNPEAEASTSSATGFGQMIDNTQNHAIMLSPDIPGIGPLASLIREEKNGFGESRYYVYPPFPEIQDALHVLRNDERKTGFLVARYLAYNDALLSCLGYKKDTILTKMTWMLGIDNTGNTAYLLHELERAPGQSAVKLLPAAAKSNPGMFYEFKSRSGEWHGERTLLELVYALAESINSGRYGRSEHLRQFNRIEPEQRPLNRPMTKTPSPAGPQTPSSLQ